MGEWVTRAPLSHAPTAAAARASVDTTRFIHIFLPSLFLGLVEGKACFFYYLDFVVFIERVILQFFICQLKSVYFFLFIA